MKRLVLKVILFFAVPLMLLEVAFYTKEAFFPSNQWFNGMIQNTKVQKLDFLFIGSSRVGAAIDESSFKQAIKDCFGREVTTANLGTGYSTMAEYYFALKRLYEYNPSAFDGMTIFIEAPTGIPSWGRWSDDWVDPGRPGLILPYLSFSELIEFLEQSNQHWSIKSRVALEKSFRSVYLIRMTRDVIIEKGGRLANEIESRLFANKDKGIADLSSAAGIRTDEEGLRLARKLAIDIAASALKKQESIDWNEMIVMDIIEFASKRGAKVVFYDMPLSSVQQKPMNTAIRQEDRRAFRVVANRLGVPILETGFECNDEDFPDFDFSIHFP
ncbi:hypothetical protein HGB07_08950 [Candidatus Roizmanbacteria bacterium]|nr:hypothetical protein [Candidatus Roizmanbacteria bacterium]